MFIAALPSLQIIWRLEQMTFSFKAVRHWLQRGAYDHADAEMRALDPELQQSHEGLHLQAFIAQKRNDWARLEELGKQLQERDPGDSGGAFCVAESLHRRGRTLEAIDVLNAAGPLFKKGEEFLYAMARLRAAAGHSDEALRLVEQAAATAPGAKDKALLDRDFESIWLHLIDNQ